MPVKRPQNLRQKSKKPLSYFRMRGGSGQPLARL
jgi:hypothetical protein